MTGLENSDETFITVAQAMREFKVDAGPATGMRWSRAGIAGIDGQRIYLRTWAIGRRIMTTRAAMIEFIESVTAARNQKVQTRDEGTGKDVSPEELRAAGLVEKRRRNGGSYGGERIS